MLVIGYKLMTILNEINTIFNESVVPLSHGIMILFCEEVLDEVTVVMKLASRNLRCLRS